VASSTRDNRPPTISSHSPRASILTDVERPCGQDGDADGRDGSGRPARAGATVEARAGEPWRAASWVVISVDPEARARTAEGDLVTLTGRTRDDLVGRRLVDCLHPDDAARAELLLTGTGRRRHPLRVTNRFVHPDGTEVWAESVLISRSTADGDDDVVLVAMPRSATAICPPLRSGRRAHVPPAVPIEPAG
jgi:PAS domain S-box-containing protein